MACAFCNPIVEKAWQNIKLQFELIAEDFANIYFASVEPVMSIVPEESDHEMSRDASEFVMV